MIPELEERGDELRRLCLQYGVQRLALFGSAAGGRFDEDKSDLDFLVEFKELPLRAYGAAYFGLLKSLEQMSGRSVDLVDDSSIKNPYLRESVDESKVVVYAACTSGSSVSQHTDPRLLRRE